jgi:hypothetical protein
MSSPPAAVPNTTELIGPRGKSFGVWNCFNFGAVNGFREAPLASDSIFSNFTLPMKSLFPLYLNSNHRVSRHIAVLVSFKAFNAAKLVPKRTLSGPDIILWDRYRSDASSVAWYRAGSGVGFVVYLAARHGRHKLVVNARLHSQPRKGYHSRRSSYWRQSVTFGPAVFRPCLPARFRPLGPSLAAPPDRRGGSQRTPSKSTSA